MVVFVGMNFLDGRLVRVDGMVLLMLLELNIIGVCCSGLLLI